MTEWNRKNAWYVMVLFLIGMLSLWGCPKKAEVTAVPEEQAPAADSRQGSQEQSAADGESSATGQETAGVEQEGLRPVYFDFDKSFIRDDAREILRSNAEWLKAHPAVMLKIEGNCDEKGTREYNQALGQRRAASVKRYLADMGIAANRISLISYGKERPVCTESDENCWHKNRRADLAERAQ